VESSLWLADLPHSLGDMTSFNMSFKMVPRASNILTQRLAGALARKESVYRLEGTHIWVLQRRVQVLWYSQPESSSIPLNALLYRITPDEKAIHMGTGSQLRPSGNMSKYPLIAAAPSRERDLDESA
jgi:hypothetical protein